MRKILISIILIGMLTIGAGVGTFAWFTSTSSSENNIFKTGTLNIEGPGTISTNLNVGNIYPGWESDHKTITVKNTGTLDFAYRLKIQSTTPSILVDGQTPLQVRTGNGEWFDINNFGPIKLGAIEPEKENVFDIQFKLPKEANNEYKDKTANLKLNFEATQVENTQYEGIYQ